MKMDMETCMGMEINITLCSRAAVLTRQDVFIVLTKVGHGLSSAPQGKQPDVTCLRGWHFYHCRIGWPLSTFPGLQHGLGMVWGSTGWPSPNPRSEQWAAMGILSKPPAWALGPLPCADIIILNFPTQWLSISAFVCYLPTSKATDHVLHLHPLLHHWWLSICYILTFNI